MAAHSEVPFSSDKLGGMIEVYAESLDTVTKVNGLSGESQVGDALHDTVVLHDIDSEGNLEPQMLEGYDTEVVPDSDDEVSDDVEGKEFSCATGSFVDGLAPPCSPCKQQRHPSVACADSGHVSGQSTLMTICKGDDNTPFTKQREIQDTEVLFEESRASLVKDVDLVNSISCAVFTGDCHVRTREIHIVYARKKRRTSLEEKREPSAAECECAGLSYVDSQEPEDISKALLFVDNYVSLNAINYSPVAKGNVNVKASSPPMSSVKGVQRLVRSGKLRDKAAEVGNFEWDQEEDRVGKSESDRAWLGSKHGKVFVRGSRKKTENFSENHTRKDQDEKTKDLSENHTLKHQDEKTENLSENHTLKEPDRNFEIGIDTQIAAEAIQELSFAHFCSASGSIVSQPADRKDGEKLTGKCLDEGSFEDSGKAKCMKKTLVKRAKRVNANGCKDNLSSFVDHENKSFTLPHETWFLSDYSKGKRTCNRELCHSEGSTERCNLLSLRSRCNMQTLLDSSSFGSYVKRKRRSSVYINPCSYPMKENGPVRVGKKQSICEQVIKGGRIEMASNKDFNHSPLTDETNLTRISGDGFDEQAGKKKATLSPLTRELVRLGINESSPELTSRYSRRRKMMSHIRVLLSNNLDKGTLKQQKKILARLGVPMVSCPSAATHFIADKFARTRNMLEFIAQGKPVVTHMWLESCEQAGSYIDERSYILMDVKKEQEIGFKLTLSLDKARQHPLLKGYKFFITQNTQPGPELLTSLIKAAHGQAVDVIMDCKARHLNDLIILSCEEDADYCVPFLERGAKAYNPELILNGIVIQKLEFERHRLFKSHGRRR